MGQKNSSKKRVQKEEIESITSSEEEENLSNYKSNPKEFMKEKINLQSSLDSTVRRTSEDNKKRMLSGKIDLQSSLDSTVRRTSEENKKLMQNHKRSSSLSLRDHPNRKRRTNSIVAETTINPPLLKTESCNSIAKKENPIFTTSKETMNVDLVRAEWENKGAAVYSALTAPPPKQKPTKYWVKTELQYVIMIPTVKRKRKSSVPPPPPPSDWEKRPPSKEWEPNAFGGKELGPQEKESFSSLGDSESDDFVPRSEAKPASKPKGRFCCAKRQDSV